MNMYDKSQINEEFINNSSTSDQYMRHVIVNILVQYFVVTIMVTNSFYEPTLTSLQENTDCFNRSK